MKCSIGAAKVEFLGFKISAEVIKMQKRLTDAILDWPTPKSVRYVRSFIGLAKFYRRFIKGYAAIVKPLLDVIRNKNFIRNKKQEESLSNLKECIRSAPVLGQPKLCDTFIVSNDASKYAMGATLEQNGHPVASLSHRLSDTEMNSDTGDKELLAFTFALRE